MGYALFAQKKLQITGHLNCIQLQHTQRSDEQFALATHTLGLQQQMTSMQAAQAGDLADLYKILSLTTEDGITRELFNQSFEDPDGYMMGQKAEEEYYRLSSQAQLLIDSNSDRDAINAAIKAKEQEFQQELDDLNREIYVTSVKENCIEMEVKRLDTQVTALQKQLDAIIEAEGAGIERSTPKFKGVA